MPESTSGFVTCVLKLAPGDKKKNRIWTSDLSTSSPNPEYSGRLPHHVPWLNCCFRDGACPPSSLVQLAVLPDHSLRGMRRPRDLDHQEETDLWQFNDPQQCKMIFNFALFPTFTPLRSHS